jgi:hypothetical protein
MGVYGRLAGSVALLAYAANSITPQLVAAFKEGVYGKNSELSTFGGVLNHVRNGNATMVDADGLLKWAPHNLFTYSEDLSGGWDFRSVDVTLGQADPDGGTGAILLSPTGADLDRVAYTLGLSDGITRTLEFIYKPVNAPGPDLAVTFTGNTSSSQNADVDLGDGWTLASWEVVDVAQFRIFLSDDIVFYAPRFYRSDLGGMVNNPATGDSYVPTTDAVRYLPRENHHVYSGSSWVKEGYLHEPEAATNLLLNTGTLSTQNVTVTAVPNTLHFTGTGTVTLSGTSTDGPLVGTGTGENNRVNLTFTPSAGTLTLTVSGTVTNADLVADPFVSSHIATAGSTVIRAADTLPLPIANIPYPEPVVIGPELVTNGLDPVTIAGWSAFYVGGSQDDSKLTAEGGVFNVDASSGNVIAEQGVATSIGKTYRFEVDVTAIGAGNRYWIQKSDVALTNGTTLLGPFSSAGSHTVVFVASATTTYVQIHFDNLGAETGSFNDVSLKEINPLAVSFGYKALVTYADENQSITGKFFGWEDTANDRITNYLQTQGGLVGLMLFRQSAGDGNVDVSSASDAYSPGINVPMSIASRHGSTFINGAVDGTALTADTTPTAFPDLSTTDLIIAPSGGPQVIQEFIMWGGTTGDIGDAGIAETSA